MNTIILPAKNSAETVPYVVNFSDRLQPGETINGASVSAIVYSGTDNSPGAIISGAATYDAFGNVTQVVTAGIPGVIYTLIYLVTGTNSHNYVKLGSLAILSNSPF